MYRAVEYEELLKLAVTCVEYVDLFNSALELVSI